MWKASPDTTHWIVDNERAACETKAPNPMQCPLMAAANGHAKPHEECRLWGVKRK
jgi:hypothetical protein